METIAELLDTLRKKEVRLRVDAGKLIWQAPAGSLSPEELRHIRDNKLEIIAALETVDAATLAAHPMRRRSPVAKPMVTVQQNWLLDRMKQTPKGAFNVCCTLDLRGTLNLRSLEGSVREVIDRHEALRTRFVRLDDTFIQEVQRPDPRPIPISDLVGTSDLEVLQFVYRLRGEFLDPFSGPLLKISVLQRAKNWHVLVLVMDHLISDGISLSIILQELGALYRRAERGTEPRLPTRAVQYPDYAVWQRGVLDAPRIGRDANWDDRLLTLPAAPLPIYPNSDTPAKYEGVTLSFESGLLHRINSAARRDCVSTPLWVLSTLASALFCWCDVEDLVIPLNVTGRHAPELSRTIGYFAHIVHLRLQRPERATFRDFLRHFMTEYARACDREDFGVTAARFPRFSKRLWVQWNPALYDEKQDSAWSNHLNAGPLTVVGGDPDSEVNLDVATEFVLQFFEGPVGVTITCQYRSDLFRAADISSFKDALLSLSDQFSRDSFTVVPRPPIFPRVGAPTRQPAM